MCLEACCDNAASGRESSDSPNGAQGDAWGNLFAHRTTYAVPIHHSMGVEPLTRLEVSDRAEN